MAGLKEIKRRLGSVKNTKKITYAMKLVSAAKLRKAQELASKSRAYTIALSEVMGTLLPEVKASDLSHPLLEKREAVRKVLVVVIGGNRGLCGGYNTNINKKVEVVYRDIAAKYPGATIEAMLVGRKVGEYFRRVKRSYGVSHEALSENVLQWPLAELSEEIIKKFVDKSVDEVVVVYTKFRSAISMSVQAEKLLPMDEESLGASAPAAAGVTLFEPSVEEVWQAILPRVLRTRIQQACFDAKASEYGSRMTAMDSATKNSGELIDKLTLSYNKLRQAGITAQILDIVGGAESMT